MVSDEEIKKIEESLKNRATTAMLTEMRKDLEKKIESIIEEIDKRNNEKNEKIESLKDTLKEIRGEINALRKEQESLDDALSTLRSFAFKYEKLHKKLSAIEEVIGVEEDINVNKIPPSILRLVYQYTLNDAIYELRKYVGYEEAEHIIKEVLQDVRTKTSGTELFKFSEGRIEARDIEKAIERKLISPKQIHLTYIEIIKKIKEYLPGYNPKNFASLLRTKGQEYAIETSTENHLRIEMIERNMESLRREMAYQENIMREDTAEIKRMLEQEIEEKVNSINSRIDEINRYMEKLTDDISRVYEDMTRITPYLQLVIKNTFEDIHRRIPPEGATRESLGYPSRIIDDFMSSEISQGKIILKDDTIYSVGKMEQKILDAIGDEFISFSEIKKRTGYDKELLSHVLEIMKEEEKVIERKYGKGKKYKRR